MTENMTRKELHSPVSSYSHAKVPDPPLLQHPMEGNWFSFDEFGQTIRIWIPPRPDTIHMAIQKTKSFYEIHLLKHIKEIVPPFSIILDVGANIGNHTVFFAKICRASKVIPFEPNPDVIPELLQNIQGNDCTNVDTRFLGIAIGAAPGRSRLRLLPHDRTLYNRGGMRIDLNTDGPIPVQKLDDLITHKIDFIKIDVEGMGLQVLYGSERIINQSRPNIFIEIFLNELPRLVEWLIFHEYQITFSASDYQNILNLFLQPREQHRMSFPNQLSIAKRLQESTTSTIQRLLAWAGLPRPQIRGTRPKAPTATQDTPQAPQHIMDYKARVLATALQKPISQVGEVLYAQLGQEELFMSDLLPIIQALFLDYGRTSSVRILDVGPRYCAGSDLLARVFHSFSYSAFTVSVDAIDVADWYAGPVPFLAPNVRHRIADVLHLPQEEKWNLVICSHVIEHTNDPIQFVEALKQHASEFLLVACPWKEQDLIDGHLYRIDETTLKQLSPNYIRIYESPVWKTGEHCIIMLFVFGSLSEAQKRRLADAAMTSFR